MEIILNKEHIIFIMLLVLLLGLFVFITLKSLRKVIEKNIAKEFQQREIFQKKLIEEVFQVQEHERDQMSIKLHDDFGSTLLGIRMFLFGKRTMIESSEFQHINIMLTDIIKGVRDLSHNLGLHNLKQYGLKKSLIELINFYLIQNNFKVVYDNNNFNEDIIDFEKQVHVYRIFQELFSNTIKYSDPKITTITISGENLRQSNLVFSYQDYGNGVPISTTMGYGIHNIKNRIKTMEGYEELFYCPHSTFSLKFIL